MAKLPNIGSIPGHVWLPIVCCFGAGVIVMIVVLALPQSYTCDPSEASYYIVDIPAPNISSITPPVLCVYYSAQKIAIQGSSFLIWNNQPPNVTINGTLLSLTAETGCSSVPVRGQNATVCTELDAVVPMNTSISVPSFANLTVIDIPPIPPHPAAATKGEPCFDTTTDLLLLVPPPTLVDVFPPVICNPGTPGYSRTISVLGANFISIYKAGIISNPTVFINGVTVSPSNINLYNCSAFSFSGILVQHCSTIAVDVTVATLASLNNVTVTNPAPAACTSTGYVQFRVVPKPTFNSVVPEIECASNSTTIVQLLGNGFLVVDNNTPTVFLDQIQVPVVSTAGCVQLPMLNHTVLQCTELDVQLPPLLSQAVVAPFQATFTIIPPYLPECAVNNSNFGVVSPPLVTSATPNLLCSQNPSIVTVALAGPSFIQVANSTPQFLIAGQSFTPILSNCTFDTLLGTTLDICTQATFQLNATQLPIGDLDIEVQNPSPFNCSAVTNGVLFNEPAPYIQSVQPRSICSGAGQTELTLTGANFSPFTQVMLIRNCTGQPASCLSASNFTGTVLSATNTTLVVNFPNSLDIPPDTYGVFVTNGGTCASPIQFYIQVKPVVLVLFVDPPTVYNGIELQATLYTTGLDATPSLVQMYNSNGVNVTLTVVNTTNSNPNHVVVVIPEGLPPGQYSFEVVTQDGCIGTGDNLVTITNETTIDLVSINPSYVWYEVRTDVTITASTSGAPFVPIPHVYLSPVNSTISAIVLSQVAFLSNYTLSSTIPANMSIGVYNLVVVNPTGEVGVLLNALTVLATQPPEIDTIQPLSYTANAIGTGTILGSYFDPTGVTIVTTCQCLYSSCTQVGLFNVTSTVVTGTVTSTSVSVSFDFSSVSAGAICLVLLINNDGPTALFSAISTISPSNDLPGWLPNAAPFLDLVVGRRAHGFVSMHVSTTTRYLVAFGGDAGSENEPLNSFEQAPLDIYGNVGTFYLNPQNYLPINRTFLGAVQVGNFLYMVGGSNGSVAQADVLRAEILNPLDTPQLDVSINILQNGTSDFTPGFWIYAVSSLYPSTDLRNPNGESLPSPVLPIQLPSIANQLILRLSWTQDPRASGYILYRTPYANQSLQSLVEIAVLNGSTTFYYDNGSYSGSTKQPLSIGDVGTWMAVSSLNVPRQGAAVQSAQDPIYPNLYYLYAIFGEDDTGTYRNDYEYLTIDVSTSDQLPSNWTLVSTNSSITGRARSGVMKATRSSTLNIVGNDTILFIPPGENSAGGLTTNYLVRSLPEEQKLY